MGQCLRLSSGLSSSRPLTGFDPCFPLFDSNVHPPLPRETSPGLRPPPISCHSSTSSPPRPPTALCLPGLLDRFHLTTVHLTLHLPTSSFPGAVPDLLIHSKVRRDMDDTRSPTRLYVSSLCQDKDLIKCRHFPSLSRPGVLYLGTVSDLPRPHHQPLDLYHPGSTYIGLPLHRL